MRALQDSYSSFRALAYAMRSSRCRSARQSDRRSPARCTTPAGVPGPTSVSRASMSSVLAIAVIVIVVLTRSGVRLAADAEHGRPQRHVLVLGRLEVFQHLPLLEHRHAAVRAVVAQDDAALPETDVERLVVLVGLQRFGQQSLQVRRLPEQGAGIRQARVVDRLDALQLGLCLELVQELLELGDVGLLLRPEAPQDLADNREEGADERALGSGGAEEGADERRQ